MNQYSYRVKLGNIVKQCPSVKAASGHHNRLNHFIEAALEIGQVGCGDTAHEDHPAFLALHRRQRLNHVLADSHVIGNRAERGLAADGGVLHAVGPLCVILEIVALSSLVIQATAQQGGDIGGIRFARLHPYRSSQRPGE